MRYRSGVMCLAEEHLVSDGGRSGDKINNLVVGSILRVAHGHNLRIIVSQNNETGHRYMRYKAITV